MKQTAKQRIIEYILNHEQVSKNDLAKELNLSLPTVINNVNSLISDNILIEKGECASTGGRKAKTIGINKSYAKALGVIISANHLVLAIVNLGYEVEVSTRFRFKFNDDLNYCYELNKHIETFLSEHNIDSIIGVGIAIPGIIDTSKQLLIQSHALNVTNYSLSYLKQAIPYPIYFENDANAAMLSENLATYDNALYLSLNNTLGGAFCINSQLFYGNNHKAGEFGHMLLVPNGKQCYCGKLGCSDAYCSAKVLTNNQMITLNEFNENLKQKDPTTLQTWDQYLEHLAILISNLRIAYDMDIILGGDVGGILKNHILELSQKVLKYNNFDHDTSYLKTCLYNQEAAAIGVAKYFLNKIELD